MFCKGEWTAGESDGWGAAGRARNLPIHGDPGKSERNETHACIYVLRKVKLFIN